MDMTKKLLIEQKKSFESVFYFGHYNLTVEEASLMLDMSQRYIYDRLKDNFDFVSVNKKQTAVFLDTEHEHLFKKRLFINRKSFRRFLLRDLKVVHQQDNGAVVYKRIQPWQVDHIMSGKARLVSMNTLKDWWGCKHNMQVYRKLRMDKTPKIALVSNSDEKPMIRYFFTI